jgi:hypothetical protein
MKKFGQLIHELKHHAPFTLIATALAIIIVIFLKFVLNLSVEEEIFEILHPLHVIASAIVSAGIFHKYKPKWLYSLFVGIFSAIVIGSLSDVIFPFLGGLIFGFEMHFHLPIIEEPLMILVSALVGSFIGIFGRITKMPHLIHVGLSIFASLFYLMAFSSVFSVWFFVISLIIVFVAVLIPCCVSDILLPFFFLGKKINSCECVH